MTAVKIISGHTNPGGSTVANINLCNLLNEHGINTVFYGPHDWHLDQCKSDKTGNLEIRQHDFLIVHYLVMPERPGDCRKVILSCHEKENYPIRKIQPFWDTIHFVSNSQRTWHGEDGVVIPNRITKLEQRNIRNGVAGVIGSIQKHKLTHVSINRALSAGYCKVLLYGEINDPNYYESFIKDYVDSGQAILKSFENNKQEMYDSLEAVYHSSESETFNYIRAECAATDTIYHGTETADPDVTLFSDEEIVSAWITLLGI